MMPFMSFTVPQTLLNDKIRENGMGEAFSMHCRERQLHIQFWSENLNGRESSEA
jgi:hypothetical protein